MVDSPNMLSAAVRRLSSASLPERAYKMHNVVACKHCPSLNQMDTSYFSGCGLCGVLLQKQTANIHTENVSHRESMQNLMAYLTKQ